MYPKWNECASTSQKILMMTKSCSLLGLFVRTLKKNYVNNENKKKCANCLTFNQLLQASSHRMNVFDPRKVKFDIFIVGLVLVSFTSSTICHRIDLHMRTIN
jgi:hypothetical protein